MCASQTLSRRLRGSGAAGAIGSNGLAEATGAAHAANASRMDLLYTAHVPAGDGPFPTILALHGWGASAHDLIGLAPILHGGGALVLCPQGPLAFEIGQGFLGFGWFELSQVRPPTVGGHRARRRTRCARFLDAALARYPIDRRKVVLMGFSQGGVMAYDLALRDPGRFAGLVALSSWLPGGARRLDSRASRATRTSRRS